MNILTEKSLRIPSTTNIYDMPDMCQVLFRFLPSISLYSSGGKTNSNVSQMLTSGIKEWKVMLGHEE